jgi:hypothetical protein
MADKIVSWGGIDSKGTTGMGVTGSISVVGSGSFGYSNIASGNTYIKIDPNQFNSRITFNDFDGGISTRGGELEMSTYYSRLTYGSYNWFYIGIPNIPYLFYIGDNQQVLISKSSSKPTNATAMLQVKGTGTTSSTTALLVQNANASASLAVLDNGNIGIGTTAPDVPLHVSSSNTILGRFQNNATAAVVQVSAVYENKFRAGTNSDNSEFWYDGGFATTYIDNNYPNTGASFNQYGDIRFRRKLDGTNLSTVMTIRGNNGDVGIGTTTPAAKLHISGSSGSALFEIDSPTVNNILFVSGSGNIGVGTSNPTATLDVSGSVAINGSNITSGWTAYTPVWTAASVNPVIGNGTIEGYYKVIGKTCFVRGNVAMGSTTTFGSGEWYISMPFTASHADAILMTANLLDNGTAWYNATMNGARAGFTTKAPVQYQAAGGTANDVNATQPFTWASTDRFLWNGSYEIA